MKEGEKRILKREVIVAQFNLTTGACILIMSYITNTTGWYECVFIIFALFMGTTSIVLGLTGYFERYQTVERLIKDLCTE